MSRKIIYGSSFSSFAYDVNALAFINAHETATGLPMGDIQKTAVNTLVLMLKGEGTTNGSDLWTLFSSRGSWIWTLTPIDDSTANATAYSMELMSATSIGSFVNFIGADITPTGVNPNNTNTKYFNTGKAVNTFASLPEMFGVYNRTSGISSNYDLGAYNGSAQARTLRIQASGNSRTLGFDSGLNTQTATAFDGLLLAGRSGSFGYTFVNGNLNTTHAGLSGSAPTNTFYFHRTNGLSTVNAIREFAMYILNIPFLDANQRADFYEAVQWYQTNVITGGRNV